ncbi:MAG: FlgD immunoglobulin-like domain containing protein, partial [Candidatus Poribacteria bacterium]
LLPNYPNPFNPETWIPFDLSKASDVTVRVYDTRGHEVRRVSLGHLDAGSYRGRSDAAHWDGRNALGEPVASGVYIYELTAGDYRAVRRMQVLK